MLSRLRMSFLNKQTRQHWSQHFGQHLLAWNVEWNLALKYSPQTTQHLLATPNICWIISANAPTFVEANKCWPKIMNMFISQIQQMLAKKFEKTAQQMLASAANAPNNIANICWGKCWHKIAANKCWLNECWLCQQTTQHLTQHLLGEMLSKMLIFSKLIKYEPTNVGDRRKRPNF